MVSNNGLRKSRRGQLHSIIGGLTMKAVRKEEKTEIEQNRANGL